MPAFGETCPAIQLRERLRYCCREQLARQLCPNSRVGTRAEHRKYQKYSTGMRYSNSAVAL
jgi:hypothetical protein